MAIKVAIKAKIRKALFCNVGKFVAIVDGDGCFWLPPTQITSSNIQQLAQEITQILSNRDAMWFGTSLFIAPSGDIVTPAGTIDRSKAVQIPL